MTEKAKQCPLCQRANGCSVQTGHTIEQCWCSKQTFPDKSLLDQVLEKDKQALLNGTACICESCLESLKADITSQQTLYKRIN
nr:cysteine-rich CWC family protein [uncultured Shewanella sp.]